jgi:Fe2+ transport system protein FeoA
MLRTGETGQIAAVLGRESCVKSFSEIGLRQGVNVKILAAGEPALCLVGDSRVSVRMCNDVEILVDVSS